MTLNQLGAVASSKSAIHTRAPEFSALMLIFRLVGPVISQRRSARPGGGGGDLPAGVLADCRRSRSGSRPARRRRCACPARGGRPAGRRGGRRTAPSSLAMKASASGVRISSNRGCMVPLIFGALGGPNIGGLLSGNVLLGGLGPAPAGAAVQAGRGAEADSVELLFFGGALEREGAAVGVQRGGHLVEVAGADLGLVLDRGVADGLVGELAPAAAPRRRSCRSGVALGQGEHRVVERVEAGQGDELERVAQVAQLVLEAWRSARRPAPLQLNDGEQL